MHTYSKKERRRAKKQAEKQKGFFIHLLVYLFVIGLNFSEGGSYRGLFSVAFWWGIGLFFHGFKVFGVPALISRKPAQHLQAPNENLLPDESLELRPTQKMWSDKDLV